MSDIHGQAKQDYLAGMKYKKIAEKYEVSINTVKSWKQRYGWQRKKDAHKNKSVRHAPKKEKGAITLKIENDELTDKQRLFVMEYLRDFNTTRAAIAAGYSKKSAHVVGWETLRNPKVQSEISRFKEQLAVDLGLDVRRVIAEHMKIAFTDISDVLEFGQKDVPVFDETGALIINPNTGEPYTMKQNYVALKNADEIDSTVISEVKKGRDGVSVKLHDKMRSLEKLERYLPYMTEEEKLKMDKVRADIKAAEMKGF